jgi:MFS family permease
MFQVFLNILHDAGETLTEAFWRQPRHLIGRRRVRMRSIFRGLNPATNVTIYTGALWLVPMAMVDQFSSLYLIQLGVGEGELGVYKSLAQLTALVGYLVGGYMSDAKGRRRTINLFDTLSWVGSALLLAVAPTRACGIAALFFLSLNASSNIAYTCLLVEGNPPNRRADVYTVLQLVNLIPSILCLPLLGGYLVRHYGLLHAGRSLYGLLFVFVCVGIWGRYHYLPDDRPKAPLHEKNISQTIQFGWGEYRAALSEFFSRPGSRAMFCSRLIDEWMMVVWLTYTSVYMVRRLGLVDADLSKLTQVGVFVTLVCLVWILPSLPRNKVYRYLGLDQVFAILSVLTLLLGKNLPVVWVCITSVALAAVAGAFFSSYSAAAWANMLEGPRRAKMLAASFAMMRLVIAATGPLGALMYAKVSPESLLVLVIGLRVVNGFLLRKVSSVLSPMIEQGGEIHWSDALDAKPGESPSSPEPRV